MTTSIATSGSVVSSTEVGYSALETALDGLVHRAVVLADKGLAEALRSAWRHASAKLV